MRERTAEGKRSLASGGHHRPRSTTELSEKAFAGMSAIDCTDCYLSIEIGDGVRRALIAHFNAFLERELAARGATAADEIARDRRDQEAWRLSAKVLSAAKDELAGALDETLLAPDPQKNIQVLLAGVVADIAAATEQHYRDDDLFGLEAFLTRLQRLTAAARD